MKLLENLQKYILYIGVAVFGVFVSKEILLVVVASLVILIWVIKMVMKGSIAFAIGRFDFAVLMVALAYLVSALTKTPNKMEAFLIPGVATFVIVSAVSYFLINQFGKNTKNGVSLALVSSGLLVSLSLLLTELKLFEKIPQLPAFIKDPSFNPLGGVVPAVIYLLPILVLGISVVVKEKDLTKKVFWGVAASVITMSLVVLIGSALPGHAQSPKFPSVQTSWEVTVEALKKSPLFGMGAGNYLTAFNQFRPVTYNQTDLWAVRFTTASNFYLTLITETGFLGLFALIMLVLAIYKYFASELKPSFEKLSVLTFLVLLGLFPASPLLVFPFFVLLSLFSSSEEHLISFRFPPILVGLVILAGVGAADFFGAKAVLAESKFKNSLVALNQNDAKKTLDSLNSAIKLDPKVDRYHATLAQVDMALASAIASKKDITDSDKKTVTQLVQNAINEGKLTVTLNPQRSGNWEVLAQIYRSIMPFAQGADKFAVQTYTQAVALDPINPNLRIALGGVYYALGRYDEAIDSFRLAVLAKSDLPNAHYNLAIAYREKKDYDNAIKEMNAVLTLVKKDSDDYKLAQTELTNLENKKKSASGESENLSAPAPVGTSNIKPPIQLPEDSTPPTGQ
jgi:tetratricopeptide (TPR) repeat protein